MTEEEQAKENIMNITKRQGTITPAKDLNLGIDWVV